MAKNLRKYHVPICPKKKVLPIFYSKKLQPKNKNCDHFGIFFGKFTNEKLRKKQSRLILICEINSTCIINTVCDFMHQSMDGRSLALLLK